MKHLKMLGLAVVVVIAMTAITGAGTASATVFCKENTTTCQAAGKVWEAGVAFKSSLESGTEADFNFNLWTVRCSSSTMNGSVPNPGPVEKVVVKLETLTFTNCGCAVNTLKAGSFNVEWTSTTMNGGMTTANREVEFTCMAHCIYGDGKMGTITGGAMATIDVSGTMNKLGGEAICPATITWEADYTVTAPEPLWIAGT
ncbi:MAG: hypothetical protein ACTHN3_01655 [Solirubrobacterales bacterium]